MVEGLEQKPGFDMMMLIGYHAGVGTQEAVMDHTYSGSCVQEMSINNHKLDEADIAVYMGGHYGICIGLISGDDKLTDKVKKSYLNPAMPNQPSPVRTVTSKRSISRYGAQMRPLKLFRKELEEEAYQAIKHLKSMPIIKPAYPIHGQIILSWTHLTDNADVIPTVKRIDGRTLAFQCDDMPAFYRTMTAILRLAFMAKQGW